MNRTLAISGLVVIVAASRLPAQELSPEIAQHVAVAQRAAGDEHVALLNLLCPGPPVTPSSGPLPAGGLPSVAGGEEWLTQPVRVFDNLLYVGQTEYSAWAVPTSEGIIVIDALFDYSAEGAIAEGLRKLGHDPSDIEYVIISHGHGDHVGGAAHLQQEYGARIVMSEPDWELVERSTASWAKPRRDIVARDGHQIRLGEVTATLHLTPGHTPGTISTVIGPIRDGNEEHVAAAWGGTAFNFRTDRDRWLRAYAESAAAFEQVVADAGADVLLANHPRFDRTPEKLPALRARGAGAAHPYVIGEDRIRAYLDVAQHCAVATRLFEAP